MPAKARPAEGRIAKIPDHKPAEVLPLDQRLSGWWQTLVVATRATMVAPGISLTVVLGLTSLFLAVAPPPLRDAPWLLVAGALILAIALSVPATYQLVQPEQFAAAAVEGKGAKFVVAYVSSCIDRVESHPNFRAFLLTDHDPEQMSARLMKVADAVGIVGVPPAKTSPGSSRPRTTIARSTAPAPTCTRRRANCAAQSNDL